MTIHKTYNKDRYTVDIIEAAVRRNERNRQLLIYERQARQDQHQRPTYIVINCVGMPGKTADLIPRQSIFHYLCLTWLQRQYDADNPRYILPRLHDHT